MPEKIISRKFITSRREILGLTKAWICISIAFGIAMSSSLFSADFYKNFIIAGLTAGIGFLLHEIGHKILAQKYGCFAEFRSFDNMLVLAVLVSFFHFILAAPGAVMISGKLNTKKNGIISLAGPAVNLILSVICLLFFFLNPPELLKIIFLQGFVINSWLAFFNMIPFWLFDGYKIFKWNKVVYGVFVVIAGGLVLFQSYI